MLKTDLGQWAKDEVTGEQGYIDDDRSCFWTWDDTECALQSKPFKGRQVKRRKCKRTHPVGCSRLLSAVNDLTTTFFLKKKILSKCHSEQLSEKAASTGRPVL